jgi:hypothetical protein
MRMETLYEDRFEGSDMISSFMRLIFRKNSEETDEEVKDQWVITDFDNYLKGNPLIESN